MSKRYSLLLSLQSLLFIALFSMLCWFSRLATDDYYFIWDVREHGIIGSVYSQYMEWCGRYAATWLMDVIYLMDTKQTWYFLYPSLSFVLLIMGIYSLLKIFFERLNFERNRTILMLLSFSFTSLLFFSSADIGETWFWYCGLSSYLLSIIAFIWGMAFLLKEGKLNFVASLLCFIYVGGSSEIYSVVYGLLFLLWLRLLYRRSGSWKTFFAVPLNKRFSAVFLVFGISFLLMVIAPGNFMRDELFPERDVLYAFVITAKSFVKFALIYLPFKCIYILAFAPVFVLIGKRFAPTTTLISFRIFLKKITLIFSILLFIFFYMVAFVMVETGPPRIWFMVSFLCTLYISVLAFYAGYCNYINDSKILFLKRAGICLSFLILIYNIIAQYPIAKTYAFKHDKRIKDIQDLNKTGLERDTQVNLTPLPPAGMLYSAEIAADTSHFTNKELRMGYDLNYQVVCNK